MKTTPDESTAGGKKGKKDRKKKKEAELEEAEKELEAIAAGEDPVAGKNKLEKDFDLYARVRILWGFFEEILGTFLGILRQLFGDV